VTVKVPAYDAKKSISSQRECVKEFSRHKSVPGGYKAVGNKEVKAAVDVIKLKAFGFAGLDFKAKGHSAPALDYFMPVSRPAIGHFRVQAYSDRYTLIPMLQLQTGKGMEILPADHYRSLVEVEVRSVGPFSVSPYGIRYLGGVGKTKASWMLGGGGFKVKHELTANRVELLLDPQLTDGEIASGGSYGVTARVLGPAPMSKYRMKWGGEVKWKSKNGEFRKEGGLWVTHGTFSVSDSGDRKALLRGGHAGAQGGW